MAIEALILLGLAKVAGIATLVKAAGRKKRIQSMKGKKKKVRKQGNK